MATKNRPMMISALGTLDQFTARSPVWRRRAGAAFGGGGLFGLGRKRTTFPSGSFIVSRCPAGRAAVKRHGYCDAGGQNAQPSRRGTSMLWPFQRANAGALRQAALHDAYQLRVRYGHSAEQWCDLGLMAARDPARRRELESIRQALAEVPW